MSDSSRPTRTYSTQEIAAFKRLGRAGTATRLGVEQGPGRGAPYFATGDWWPTHLLAAADRLEKLAADARLAATAMRREIEHDATGEE